MPTFGVDDQRPYDAYQEPHRDPGGDPAPAADEQDDAPSGVDEQDDAP